MKKTYLVDETFAGRITFRHAGLSPADEDSRGLLKLQLEQGKDRANGQGKSGTCNVWNGGSSWEERRVIFGIRIQE